MARNYSPAFCLRVSGGYCAAVAVRRRQLGAHASRSTTTTTATSSIAQRPTTIERQRRRQLRRWRTRARPAIWRRLRAQKLRACAQSLARSRARARAQKRPFGIVFCYLLKARQSPPPPPPITDRPLMVGAPSFSIAAILGDARLLVVSHACKTAPLLRSSVCKLRARFDFF